MQGEPRQLKKAHAQLTLKTGTKFSLQCLASAFKKRNFSYKRCRRTLKQQRDEACFLQAKIQLTQLAGETIGLPSDAHTKRINVLGFSSRKQGAFFQSH